MSAAAALAVLETAEFHAVDALGRMAQLDPQRAQLQELLSKARAAEAGLLVPTPDMLRKGANKLSLSLPAPAAEVAKTVRETADRLAEARRFAKRSGRQRYRAPEELRGKSIQLIDRRKLDVPEHGYCEVADSRHPASPDATASPAHYQLVTLGFLELLDDREDEMDVVKASLRRPIIGDAAVIAFLGRNGSR